jgi:asparaginyl-tRNA synthetase
VRAIISHVLEKCTVDFKELKRDTALLERVIDEEPFPRITYKDAVESLQQQGSQIKWGDDLGGGDETIISEAHDKPVFVCNYPAEAKAFYMEDSPDGDGTVLCSDLLAPAGYGEIIGGSERVSSYERLEEKIKEADLPREAFEWYLDLRKFGTFQHSGFGLGLERTVGWICGIPHVREAIPFPRMMKRLYP